jgi:hypothetical protein
MQWEVASEPEQSTMAFMRIFVMTPLKLQVEASTFFKPSAS